MVSINKTTKSSLKSGRPPLTVRSGIQNYKHADKQLVNARKKSSKATRTLINKHHQLHKSRASALAAGKLDLVADLDKQIQQLGGLEAYQQASLTGQDKDRGGDSGEKLVEWLQRHRLVGSRRTNPSSEGLRVLEVGALSSRNAISSMIDRGVASVRRIDLHSQEPANIEEVDFMDLPAPTSEQEQFDIVSLSLVLNYVPDVAQRGEMLRRTTLFLRRPPATSEGALEADALPIPCLFVVLPLPCLNNSRYITSDHFVSIMATLGYVLVESHNSQKLSYMLFRWDEAMRKTCQGFKKAEVNPGRARNNFAIVLEPN